MKHSVIYKSEKEYCSFPLIHHHRFLEDTLVLGFFSAPVPDHCGVYDWKVMCSHDEGETWNWAPLNRQDHYIWPATSAREKYDRLVLRKDRKTIITGSWGYLKKEDGSIRQSNSLFHRVMQEEQGDKIKARFHKVPDMEVILTFPRPLQLNRLILIPAYGLSKDFNVSRCFIWRSTDQGQTFKLWNMFPTGVQGNEVALINISNSKILAHVRSDIHPYLMESWSINRGKTWTYPTTVMTKTRSNVIGGPPHLLRLKDGRMLCSYGFREVPGFEEYPEHGAMGVRAIISEDDGVTWSGPIILRRDAGYSSSLSPQVKWKWIRRFPPKIKAWVRNPGEDVGYPVSIQLKDESILTVYYITNEDQITYIGSTKWRIE